MAQNVELLASYWTIAGGALPHTDKDYSPFDFKDRVESAAKAGFKGIGIWHTDLAHTLEKRSLREMKQILDDNGMKHLELEFLTGIRDTVRFEVRKSDSIYRIGYNDNGSLTAEETLIGALRKKKS